MRFEDIPLDSKVELIAYNGGKPHTFETKVDMRRGDSLCMTFKSKSAFQEAGIGVRSTIKVQLPSQMGVYYWNATVEEVTEIANVLFVYMSAPKQAGIQERRKVIRVPLRTDLCAVYGGRTRSGVTEDISTLGIGFIVKESLFTNAVVKISFPIEDKLVHATVKVTRVEQRQDGNFTIGAVFVDMPLSYSNTIKHYILKFKDSLKDTTWIN